MYMYIYMCYSIRFTHTCTCTCMRTHLFLECVASIILFLKVPKVPAILDQFEAKPRHKESQ